jgi:hypothetical protein
MRNLILALPILALAGCANKPTPAQIVFAASSTLSGAEIVASGYESNPAASPAVTAKIKALDATAYSIVQPLVAQAAMGANVVTALQADAAQAAVAALTTYEAQNGVK